MDTGYLVEVLTLLLRWLHLIVGIAWIGASFYFVWLDNSLKPPTDMNLVLKGVGGELWAVHGGGFYNPQKYTLAPAAMPEKLHWFMWEAYSTWITGFLLISTLYYLNAASYMVDPAVAALTPLQAVGIGLATLAGGWVFYDLLCRMLFSKSQVLLGAVYFLFVLGVAWGLSHLISGRAAYLHVGAMIATAMSANVFFRIIPGQKRVIASIQKGEPADPADSLRARQRSVHNNYLTLPVLFCMVSNHFSFTYAHRYSWAVLGLILLGAVLIRHWFNLRHKGEQRWYWPAAGALLLLAAFTWTAPAFRPATTTDFRNAAPKLADIAPIISMRCVACHAAKPTLMAAAPSGVMLDTPERIRIMAPRIYHQAVVLRAMPLGNATGITEAERARIAEWFERGAQ